VSDLLRARVQAIQKLAEAATEGPWETNGCDLISTPLKNRYQSAEDVLPGEEHPDYDMLAERVTDLENAMYLGETTLISTDDKERAWTDARFIAAARTEVPWLSAALLEALDTIDKAKRLHFDKGNGFCYDCDSGWPCPTWQALNGGNEAEDDR